jgi:hypothetical protein
MILSATRRGERQNRPTPPAVFSALSRGPSTAFRGPPMRTAHREDKGAAVFIPYREAMGEYAGGGGRPA